MACNNLLFLETVLQCMTVSGVIDRLLQMLDDEITFSPEVCMNETLDDTLPMVKKIQIHHGSALQDLFQLFMKKNMQPMYNKFEIEKVITDGTVEAGEDNGGVLRDCLSEIRQSFYE